VASGCDEIVVNLSYGAGSELRRLGDSGVRGSCSRRQAMGAPLYCEILSVFMACI
jgi:hypothetical protein